MSSRTSQEEALSRLAGLFSSLGDVRSAVEAAVRQGKINPERFGIRAEDLQRRLERGTFAGAEAASTASELLRVANPIGLEAIVRRVGRPPMLIRNDRVVYEPVPLLPSLTEKMVNGVQPFIASVGRVEFINHAMRWGGTGFVVDERPGGRRRVVTNRHVAKLIARRARGGAGVFMRSPIGALYGARLDMREEVDTKPGTEFELPVTSIVYLADDTEADAALLEIQTHDGLAPAPLPLAGRRAADQETVATVGYPAFDDRNGLAEMREYFGDLFEVKRFAPGLVITSGAGTVLSHDCTTLGGNSGSCLISLDQQAVVGLHFSGEFGVANAAVSVETLKTLLSGSLFAISSRTPEAVQEARRDGAHEPNQLVGREGYDPTFLGGDRAVAWPTFGSSIAEDIARPSDATAEKPLELRYTNFGVLYSQRRRCPRVTAVNIDGARSVRIKRDDDQWFFDLRIPLEMQLGQRDFGDPEIDRGHMVRREDPNWGPTARRANDDTFHYTNAALQHSSLNQGKTLWQGLENYILDSARTHDFRACVFTGPIFREDDPQLQPSNAQVPREFWKIVAMPSGDGGLHATGYVFSQGDLIRELLEQRNRSEAVEGFVLGPYRTFQVAIAHIEEATGLAFPALRAVDPLARTASGDEAVGAEGIAYVPLDALADIVLTARPSGQSPGPQRNPTDATPQLDRTAAPPRSPTATAMLDGPAAAAGRESLPASGTAAAASKVDCYLTHRMATFSTRQRPLGVDVVLATAESVQVPSLRVPMLLRVDLVRFNARAVAGLEVHAAIGSIVAATANREALEAIRHDPAVIAIEASRDLAIEDTAASVPFARGDVVHRPPLRESGNKALVAVIDGGIDVLHECFRDAAGRSRIEAVWDQSDPTGPTPAAAGYPAGLNFGTLHTRADIARYIASGAIPAGLGRDSGGHGTHVTSIAAGRAVGAFAGGMAPDASIVFVRPKLSVNPGDPFSLGYSVSHVAALTFIGEVADRLNLPVVVNVSLGMNAGAHDGTSLLETAFDDFSEGGRAPGRVVVKSAGNERAQDGHARLVIASNQLEQFVWRSAVSHSGPDDVEVWFSAGDDLRFRLLSPRDEASTWVDRNAPRASGGFTSGEHYELTFDRYFRDNGDSRLLVTVSDSAVGQISIGNFALEIEGRTVMSPGVVDAWIERDDRRPIRFVNHLENEVTLSIPGTARTVVAVACVASGTPIVSSTFSSMGPSRDARCKPDVSAPGDPVTAAASGTATGTVAMSGTSMATPHVAGAVALALSHCARNGRPIPNAMQVSSALRITSHGFRGRHTPAVGYGVLDAAALVNALQ